MNYPVESSIACVNSRYSIVDAYRRIFLALCDSIMCCITHSPSRHSDEKRGVKKHLTISARNDSVNWYHDGGYICWDIKKLTHNNVSALLFLLLFFDLFGSTHNMCEKPFSCFSQTFI